MTVAAAAATSDKASENTHIHTHTHLIVQVIIFDFVGYSGGSEHTLICRGYYFQRVCGAAGYIKDVESKREKYNIENKRIRCQSWFQFI